MFKYMQLFSRCFCTYRLLYWLWQKHFRSDQTNLPPTCKTQGQNPTTDRRQTDVVLHCGWFFQPASCKLMRSLTSFHGHNNCNPLAWSSKNRNPVAHQNTQTPLLVTTPNWSEIYSIIEASWKANLFQLPLVLFHFIFTITIEERNRHFN